MTSDLQALLSRLETATEGSRELDCLIAPIVGWYRITPSEAKRTGHGSKAHGGWVQPNDVRDGKPMFCQLHGTDVYRDPPEFSRSVDAALSLVPEGWYVENLSQAHPECGKYGLTWLCQLARQRRERNPAHRAECRETDARFHPTPALALVVAALRARGA
jgi:hypothetical protein